MSSIAGPLKKSWTVIWGFFGSSSAWVCSSISSTLRTQDSILHILQVAGKEDLLRWGPYHDLQESQNCTRFARSGMAALMIMTLLLPILINHMRTLYLLHCPYAWSLQLSMRKCGSAHGRDWIVYISHSLSQSKCIACGWNHKSAMLLFLLLFRIE